MLFAALFLLAAPSAHTRPVIHNFRMKDDEVEYADTKGTFEMQARPSISGGHYKLSVWNVMPDNPQILSFDADGTYRAGKPTPIRFIDSFDNQGRGSFTVKGRLLTIDIQRTKTSDYGANIGRSYGRYTLASGRKCRWEGD